MANNNNNFNINNTFDNNDKFKLYIDECCNFEYTILYNTFRFSNAHLTFIVLRTLRDSLKFFNEPIVYVVQIPMVNLKWVIDKMLNAVNDVMFTYRISKQNVNFLFSNNLDFCDSNVAFLHKEVKENGEIEINLSFLNIKEPIIIKQEDTKKYNYTIIQTYFAKCIESSLSELFTTFPRSGIRIIKEPNKPDITLVDGKIIFGLLDYRLEKSINTFNILTPEAAIVNFTYSNFKPEGFFPNY